MTKNYNNDINVSEDNIIDFTESKITFDDLSKKETIDHEIQKLQTNIDQNTAQKNEDNNKTSDLIGEIPNIPDAIVQQIENTDISDVISGSDAVDLLGDVASFIAEGLSGL